MSLPGTVLIRASFWWHPTFLCQRDSVVLQEDHTEAVSYHWVVVNHIPNGCDEFDDHLGHVVSRGSLWGHSQGSAPQPGPLPPSLQPSQANLSLGVKGPELQSASWLLTLPPIITVRGTTNLLGSCLMPVEKTEVSGPGRPSG